MKTYLALTIGPVYRTIQRARKTRELWVASFLLSQFMKSLLLQLRDYGQALSPDIETLDNPTKYHGAGIWNDNCFFEIKSEKLQELKTKLPAIIQKAKKEIIQLALFDLEREKEKNKPLLDQAALEQLFARHFHCHAVLFTPNGTQEKVLETLSSRTASAEMRDLFPSRHDDLVSNVMFRGRAVRSMYHLGFEDDKDPVFTHYKSRFDGFESSRRLPSLLELAVREFKRDSKVYSRIEDIISQKIQDKSDDVETDEENQAIIDLLKKQFDVNGKTIFKKRNKYVAVVQSDGDGIGGYIQQQTDPDTIKRISKALMQFSTGAVKLIVDHDALPVYAGGDDLLFIAPLRNKDEKSIFELLGKIRKEFQSKETLAESGKTLSFGVSIFYYKYPLGEGLENGRELLGALAKKLVFKEQNGTFHKKNALGFRVMLHAGQSFGTVLKQHGTTWDAWESLLKSHPSVQSDAAFVAGVVHTLERLEWLLAAACNQGTTNAFFERHFNEAKKGTPRWDFVQQVRKLAEAIYEEYAELFPADNHGNVTPTLEQIKFYRLHLELPEEDFPDELFDDPNMKQKLHIKFCNNLLYSALRMIQFLNADDHE